MKNKLEIRSIGNFENEENTRKIHGLAIPVESLSGLLYGEFYETISRDAVNDELIQSNDVKLYLNHDASQGTFARSKYGNGSLKLFVTGRGLEFETELPETEKGNELLKGIERGDYDAISFAFVVGEEHFDNKPNNDGTWNRYIDKIAMLDEISILSVAPAYDATSVNLRSLELVKEKYQEEINNQMINKELDVKLMELEDI
jgi:hypothetical protein